MPRALKPKPYKVWEPFKIVCYSGIAGTSRSTEKQATAASNALDRVCWTIGCRAAIARGYRHRVVRLDAVELPYEAPAKKAKGAPDAR